MKINKKAAIIGTILALPFMALASYFWILIFFTSNPTDQVVSQWISTAIFLLGSPLTLLYLLSLPFLDRFLTAFLGNNLEFLVLPVFNLLFLLQWILWSQLIAFIYRKFSKLNKLP